MGKYTAGIKMTSTSSTSREMVVTMSEVSTVVSGLGRISENCTLSTMPSSRSSCSWVTLSSPP